jgi:phosphoenolpyruvate-protein kinase (PTS system EI component)
MSSLAKKHTRRPAIERLLIFNPATGNYIVLDGATGQLAVQPSDKPANGLRKVYTNIKANPRVSKSTARKAEKAVIWVKNNAGK